MVNDWESEFLHTTLRKGRNYQRDGHVYSVRLLPNERVVKATVIGHTPSISYNVIIYFDSFGRYSTSRCSCPVGRGCKHAAAVLYELGPYFNFYEEADKATDQSLDYAYPTSISFVRGKTDGIRFRLEPLKDEDESELIKKAGEFDKDRAFLVKVGDIFFFRVGDKTCWLRCSEGVIDIRKEELLEDRALLACAIFLNDASNQNLTLIGSGEMQLKEATKRFAEVLKDRSELKDAKSAESLLPSSRDLVKAFVSTQIACKVRSVRSGVFSDSLQTILETSKDLNECSELFTGFVDGLEKCSGIGRETTGEIVAPAVFSAVQKKEFTDFPELLSESSEKNLDAYLNGLLCAGAPIEKLIDMADGVKARITRLKRMADIRDLQSATSSTALNDVVQKALERKDRELISKIPLERIPELDIPVLKALSASTLSEDATKAVWKALVRKGSFDDVAELIHSLSEYGREGLGNFTRADDKAASGVATLLSSDWFRADDVRSFNSRSISILEAYAKLLSPAELNKTGEKIAKDIARLANRWDGLSDQCHKIIISLDPIFPTVGREYVDMILSKRKSGEEMERRFASFAFKVMVRDGSLEHYGFLRLEQREDGDVR